MTEQHESLSPEDEAVIALINVLAPLVGEEPVTAELWMDADPAAAELRDSFRAGVRMVLAAAEARGYQRADADARRSLRGRAGISEDPLRPSGLYGKFRVARVDGRDGPGGDKADARYFVLDYIHDPYARVALAAYADACEANLPHLAADLRRELADPGAS